MRGSIYAAYWGFGKMPHRQVAAHTPDVCWVSQGWECIASGLESLPMSVDMKRTFPMEQRAFRLNVQTEHVVFCHLVGSRRYVGVVNGPIWTRFFADIVRDRLEQRKEQLFLRISSNRRFAELKDLPSIKVLTQRFGREWPVDR